MRIQKVRFAATLAVVAGYLAADALLNGFAAAFAVLALGIGEFLVLLVLPGGGRHPGLIIEAAVLAGAGLLGDVLSAAGYPGAGYAVLELIMGTFLAGTALAGRPWLADKLESTAGMRTSRDLSRDASMVLGAVFVLHGMILSAMAFLAGGVSLLPAVASFALLYAGALTLLRRRVRSLNLRSAPVLSPLGDGGMELTAAGMRLALLMAWGRGRIEISGLLTSDGVPLHRVLDALESALTSTGALSVTLKDWQSDTLSLELAGYTQGPAGWTKPLARPR
jgi:hypothetical protein